MNHVNVEDINKELKIIKGAVEAPEKQNLMRLRQGWILFLLILAAHSSYCQYPLIKKINQDSVVIMTLQQGREINGSFERINRKIDSLNDTAFYYNKLKFRYDSVYKILHLKQDSINIWQGKYKTSVELFKLRPKSRTYDSEEKFEFAQKIILIAIILIQFNSLR